jgi:hypothetical protein
MQTLKLTQGKVAVVDDDDIALLPKRKWYAVKDTRTFYAHAKINGKSVPLHRLIMNPSKGMVVDHIDGDGLNNRRNNLRIVSQKENASNRTRVNKNNKVGVSGVSYKEQNKKWVAQATNDGKRKHIGYANSTEEAIALLSKNGYRIVKD